MSIPAIWFLEVEMPVSPSGTARVFDEAWEGAEAEGTLQESTCRLRLITVVRRCGRHAFLFTPDNMCG